MQYVTENALTLACNNETGLVLKYLRVGIIHLIYCSFI